MAAQVAAPFPSGTAEDRRPRSPGRRAVGRPSWPAAAFALAWALLAPLGSPGQVVDPDGAGPTPEQIDRAVEQLGDDRFMVRQRASQFLWESGRTAEGALRKALASTDAEVVARARQILRRFKYGIYPDTPPAVVALIHRYRLGDFNGKRKVLRDLVQQGEVRTMLRLVDTESDPALRQQLTAAMIGDARDIVPQLMLAGETAEAEKIIELAANGSEGMRNWAAYLLVRGRLDAKIAELRREADEKPDAGQWRLLAYLLRAAGDLDGALEAARRAEVEALTLGLLLERGGWNELAEHQEAEAAKRSVQLSKPVESLGYLAAYHRLAGNGPKSQAAIKAIEKLAAEKPKHAWHCGEALLINHRFEEATTLLGKDHVATVFDLLVSQLRFREALRLEGVDDPQTVKLPWMAEVADPQRAANAQQKAEMAKQKAARFAAGLRVAGVFYRLGEQEIARRLFDELAHTALADEKLKCSAVCKAETEAGVPRLETHAALAIVKEPAKEVLAAVYADEADLAMVWWEYAETIAGQDAEARLRLVDESLAPPPQGTLTADLVRKAVEKAKGLDSRQRTRWLWALGEASRSHGWTALARQCHEQAAALVPSAKKATRVGDLLAEEGNWSEAADWYRRAWEMDKKQPLPLYLNGRALVRSGDKDHGQKQMDLAVLMPLASGTARYVLAKGLQDRNLDEEASRQWELIIRTGQPGEWFGNEAAKQRGNEISGDDNLKAAAYWERLLLSCLQTSTGARKMAGYLKLLHLVHKARGRGLLAEGRVDEALAEIELARRALPGETRLAEDLVPELEKAGKKADADALFDAIYGANRKVTEDFPHAATWLNNTAWLAAQCNRRLDEALKFATRASQLDPDKPAYLDTLAEVHHRRGNREEAVRLAQRCVELAPKQSHYREQLARFEKGGP